MNTFKLSQKEVHKDSRSSIENVHDKYMSKIQARYDSIETKEQELKILKDSLNDSIKNKKFKDIPIIKDSIHNLETEIKDIKNHTELTDYLAKAVPFIQESNNIKEPTDIEDKTGILKYVTSNGTTDKGTKYNEYLETCFNIPFNNQTVKPNVCKTCDSSNRVIDSKESLIVCSDCGTCEIYTDLTYNTDWSRTDSTEFIQVFTYKRKNHFKEWLTHLQAKESTIIPQDILNLIYMELKKERIVNTSDITHTKIRQYLKKLRLNKYYEHIPNIIQCITKESGLCIDDELEKKLMHMFDLIQEPFIKACPPNRKNFLSYSFTLHKFCQLLNRNDLLIYFPLLKSREKLFEQEKIWKNICAELKWSYISSI